MIRKAAIFYDAAVSGSEAAHNRAGFIKLLEYTAEHNISIIIVEECGRFARDLVIQEMGYARLKDAGYKLIAADNPDQFLSETPTAIFIRQLLGAIKQFEKSVIAERLRSGRERRAKTTREKTLDGNPRIAGVATHLFAGKRGEKIQTVLQPLARKAKLARGELAKASRTLFVRRVKTSSGKPIRTQQLEKWIGALTALSKRK